MILSLESNEMSSIMFFRMFNKGKVLL